MCKYCKEILDCWKSESKTVTIASDSGSDSSMKIEMVIERDYQLFTDSYIRCEHIDNEGNRNDIFFDINYCPCCGVDMRKEYYNG